MLLLTIFFIRFFGRYFYLEFFHFSFFIFHFHFSFFFFRFLIFRFFYLFFIFLFVSSAFRNVAVTVQLSCGSLYLSISLILKISGVCVNLLNGHVIDIDTLDYCPWNVHSMQSYLWIAEVAQVESYFDL